MVKEETFEESNQRREDDKQLWKICLTGGPCGGKSTCMTSIDQRLSSLGYKVFRVPEAATLFITGGVGFGPAYTEECSISTQIGLLKTQMALEDTFVSHARASCDKAIILCDRGAMDGSAYMTDEGWQALLDKEGWTIGDMRDARYDHVLHLVTAAIGAEEHYTGTNNAARLETAEEAASLDRAIAKAWVGHQDLRVLDNSTNFAEKVERAVVSICKHVGAPVPTGHKRYFLVTQESAKAMRPVANESGEKVVDMQLEYDFLNSDMKGNVVRLQKRDYGEGKPSTYTRMDSMGGGIPGMAGSQMKRNITKRVYDYLLSQVDPKFNTLIKRRQVFTYNNQYWEVDTIKEPATHAGMSLLCVDVFKDQLQGNLDMPPYIDVVQEVTNDYRYLSYDIAKKPIVIH